MTNCSWNVKSLLGIVCLALYLHEETNLALNKPSKSSSRHPDSPPPNVGNDGSPNTSWDQRSCFSSNPDDLDPWWQVDLQNQVLVHGVKITTRTDCCWEQLPRDFTLDVFVTDPTLEPQSRARRCYFYAGVTFPGVVTVNCTRPVIGRFLRISKKKECCGEFLVFCELQVFKEVNQQVWESCSSFTKNAGKRYITNAIEIMGPQNASRAECATKCERDIGCVGFNIQYQPEVTCELAKDPYVDPVEAASWDSYQLNGCWRRCG